MRRSAITILVLVLLAAIAFIVVRDPWRGEAEPQRQDPAEGLTLARRACASLDETLLSIDANRSADVVLDELDRAVDLAGSAYSADVRWLRLLSSAKSLRAGLRTDSADAARAGLATARDECSSARSKP